MSHCNCSRRSFIRSAVAGSMLWSGLVREILAENTSDPLAPKPTHYPAKAKSVIFLFMSGGVSHVDSFDPKPRLWSEHGKEVKLDHPETRDRAGYEKLFLKRPDWKGWPRGKSGVMVTDLFPAIANSVDDIALIRSMHTDHSNHYNATLGMHTGSFAFTRPSIGSWVSYGLGTENRDLPSFVALAPAMPYAGTQVWGSDFLPAEHQGTRVVPGSEPIPNLAPRVTPPERQSRELATLAELNQIHRRGRTADPYLSARIRSFETAFGMQSAMPDVLDVSRETDSTLHLYGIQRGQSEGFGWQCLVARRLVERGVRFIELIHTGSSNNWDSHGDMADHGKLAPQVDQPIAGLLQDLKQRGLFDETLIVWTSEFGRTPFNNTPENKGREHHNWAFSSWLAGAGVKRGCVHGATDEFGINVERDHVHVHDFHATILHLMGLDHTKLTYRHAGRDYRLTDVAGNVVEAVLS